MTTSTKPTIEQCLGCKKVDNCNGQCPRPSLPELPQLERPKLTYQWQEYGMSPRRRQIFILIARGHTALEISKILKIHPNTVKNHTYEVHQKLKVRNSIAAIIKCLQLGIFKLEEIEVK